MTYVQTEYCQYSQYLNQKACAALSAGYVMIEPELPQCLSIEHVKIWPCVSLLEGGRPHIKFATALELNELITQHAVANQL